jgi:hypothetical protein
VTTKGHTLVVLRMLQSASVDRWLIARTHIEASPDLPAPNDLLWRQVGADSSACIVLILFRSIWVQLDNDMERISLSPILDLGDEAERHEIAYQRIDLGEVATKQVSRRA